MILWHSFNSDGNAPEFEHRPKSVSWYWISIIIAATVIAFAIWEQNFLFGIFIVIAEVLFITWGNEAPAMVDFALTDSELAIGDAKRYAIKLFENFSVSEQNEAWAELYLHFQNKMADSPEGACAESEDRRGPEKPQGDLARSRIRTVAP